ncbi:reverse transcriptase [Lasius niger]|uniref:Reverse transcriptase n=1 Tax=Lasius niger TaxID=67767 RepID=A0A0J7K9Q1_LASNI|nr:reverse transcriptase [Lasius niger]
MYGGLIIEVPGPEGASLANTLQEKLKVARDNDPKGRRWYALNVLQQYILEKGASICAISEPPPGVAHSEKWFSSTNGTAAIMWVSVRASDVPCNLVRRGKFSVVVLYRDVYVASCYISPNVPIETFQEFLDELDYLLRYTGGNLLVYGDFNSKDTLWGCPSTDRRGSKLANWAATRDLRLLNRGNIPTFVDPQGFSIVDLSWASPILVSRIVEWSVVQDAESLSDHAYIWMVISDTSSSRERSRPTPKGWSFKRMDSDLFAEVLKWYGVSGPGEDDLESASSLAGWITRGVCDACDVSTFRLGSSRERRSSYWWNDTIADCRKVSISARRQLIRSRRRGNTEEIDSKKLAYKIVKKNLRSEINRVKKNAWDELILSINDDPWGLPYKVVLNKLRSAGPGLSERVSARILARLLGTLFPAGTLPSAAEVDWQIPAWDDVWNVSISEVEDVIATILDEAPLKARSICLLDEAGKALEKIIAARIHDWMDENPMSGLSEWQFGFRRHRSTVDALFAVRDFIETAVSAGGVAIAVSLDITNAFNSIFWIKSLGLSIAAQKTEAVYFHGRGKKPRIMPTVYIDNAYVTSTASMKYLGVIIDSGWTFEDHFRYMEAKTSKVSRALFRLMPNLRGPHEGKRKLYANVLTSVITYAAPVWSDALSSASLRTRQPVVQLQRSMAIRVVSAYRTLSFDVATLLACMTPWALEVDLRRRVYSWVTDLRTRGEWTKEAVAEIKAQERIITNRHGP